MAKDVLPALNKTVSVWLADGLQISPDDVPPGTVFNVYQDLKTAGAMLSSSSDAKVVVSMASQMWCKNVMLSRSVALPRLVNLESINIADLDSECSGYNQNAWGCAYSFQGPHGSWLEDPAWGQQQRERFLGGEAAVWGEGISVDNFDSFVWRSASAIAERLWTTEERLMCPPSHCPGISGADDGFGPGNGTRYWLTPGGPSGNYARFADQLCRMSRRGARTGPISPGFCPSDADDQRVSGRITRLEAENSRLRREVAALRAQLKSDDASALAGRGVSVQKRQMGRGSCRIFNDTDFDGHDLKMGETATVELCCALCDATAGCGYWTFMPPKTCFMKTSNAGRRVLATHTSGCKSMSCALPAPAPPAPPPPPPAPPPMPQLLAFPLPFPLPARAKFGRCPGAHPPLDARIAAGCAATMVLRDDFTVVCDPKCTPSCRTSALFRTVVAHFEQLLTGANTSSASPLSDAGLPRADRRATAPLHGVLGSVSVCVRSASEELGPSTNESYSLRVPAGAANSSADQVATLTAATIFGARHGLESFFQLLDVRSQGQPLQLRSAPVIIDDEPRFHYRGLMIDSSRHFLPLHHIKHIIATAAQVKLNLIHWHMTDTQSFSTGSATFPELAAKGAFPNGYSGQTGNSPAAGIAPNFFSPSQMREVVQFAKEHGVRVMPEWGKSSVSLICAHLAR